MDIQDLSNEIKNLMKELNINKNSLNSFNKVHLDNLTNKIIINCRIAFI